jgi:hypothetical protein
MVDGNAVSQTFFPATIDCFGDAHRSAILHKRALLTVGGHGLLTTPVEGQWIINDVSDKPAGTPYIHYSITEIFSDSTGGMSVAYPGRLIMVFIVERKSAF